MKPLLFGLILLGTLGALTGCQTPTGGPTSPDTTNLVTNGDFSQGSRDWTTYVQNGGALTLGTAAGRADVTGLSLGTGAEPYFDVQLKHSSPGISLSAGKTYTLSFEAWADAQRYLAVSVWENGRDINGDGTSWGAHCFFYADLSTTPQQFTRTFTMLADNPASGLCFACGSSTVSVHVAKVKLVLN